MFSIDSNIFWRQFQVDFVMSHGAAGRSGSQPNLDNITDHSLMTSFSCLDFNKTKFKYILAAISQFDYSMIINGTADPGGGRPNLRDIFTTRI